MVDRITKQNTAFYDSEAFTYDQTRYTNEKGKRVDQFQKRILDDYLVDCDVSNVSILEVGCGTGRFLPFIAERGANVIGIDISAEMLKIAAERIEKSGSENISLVLNDIDKLPFSDNNFGVVYAILVINLIPNYVNAFEEIKRVLKPRGTFIFSVPYLSGIYFPAGLYVNTRGKTVTANRTGYRYSHWFSTSELIRCLDATNFSIETIKGQPPHVRMTDNVSPLGSGFGLVFSKSIYVKAKAN